MGHGWIKLHRKLQDCWIWTSTKPFDERSAWIDLLLSANHADKEIVFNGKPMTIKRGQVLTSVRRLSERWHWSVNRTYRFLDRTQNDEMLQKESNKDRTLLTIVNYEVYQYCETPTETVSETQTETQTEHKQEYKEIKNTLSSEKKSGGKKFIPPTEEEVEAYCQMRGNGISGAEFVNSYASKGWMIGKTPMKDWKRAVITWELKRGFHYEAPKKNKSIPDEYADYETVTLDDM